MKEYCRMNSTDKSYLFACLAVLCWSTVATAFKISLRNLDFIQLIYVASIVTVVILFVFLLINGKINNIFRQTVRQYIYSVFLGALNPMLYYLVLFKAYSLLPAQVAQPLNMVWPIVLALLSVPLLGQKIGFLSIAALFVSFAGVVIISSQGDMTGYKNTNIAGVMLALGSSVIWSLYWILNVRDKRDEIVKLFLNFFFGLIFLSLCMIFFSDFRINTGTGFYAAIYVGIFEAGIVYVFWMKALQLSKNNARIGNIIFLSPFISLIFIRFILKETLFITTFIGLIFIVTGIFLQQFDKKSREIR
jgi:drug/metabolite transporter (DMT)-like permease